MIERQDIIQQIRESSDVKNTMIVTCVEDIEKGAELMVNAVKNGKKILWCGNGGSAADAQHMAAELMGGLRSHDRPAIQSIALTTDTSFITAWSNDTDYESIFSRQIEGLGNAGDVLMAISTSGNSKNVIKAVEACRAKGISVIVLTGKTGGVLKELGDVTVSIPSDDTQRIQEGHLLAEHILCAIVEKSVTG
ncbi:MAG TPA: SIS domain-containing protein [Candidatus Marinimicrobia bacterium]|jgi:D-sedoheptulose 7-phosphate isomerase|nr:SIS domain-containing protein [Candidatus Neomarinimicrobiota bacterium]MDP7217549.1 SIS domain-containing protein [Candidatus Neomarinimicrobiota bacterium]MDP7437787.1 SIS domain-containing protein [Candidatus Neomarinimicrobiota bacterium]HBN44986.1 phosphoheptose isomerase [Candidatus Neomarinimicrobiota bacterium]HJL73800.1 SIS domain-containing protein [Candidatus Neomarinimicrobiota bacterium]|tara:strand:+ start:7113 stop:7691 length:579 start_codon:yes stop_codon:yes gene_type:complete